MPEQDVRQIWSVRELRVEIAKFVTDYLADEIVRPIEDKRADVLAMATANDFQGYRLAIREFLASKKTADLYRGPLTLRVISMLFLPDEQQRTGSFLVDAGHPNFADIVAAEREIMPLISKVVRLPQVKVSAVAPTERSASVPDEIKLADREEPYLRRAFFHELGHVIADNNPAVNDATKAFLMQRAKSADPRPLREITGREVFRPDEMAYNLGLNFDNIFEGKAISDHDAAYAGKVDTGPGSNEILPTGIEVLMTNPILFAAQEPVYFELVVGSLRGAPTAREVA